MFNNFNVNMTYFCSLKEIFYCRRHFSPNIGRGKDWIKIRFIASAYGLDVKPHAGWFIRNPQASLVFQKNHTALEAKQRKIFSKCRLRDKKYSHSEGERGRRRHMGKKRSVESESFLKVFLSKDFVMVP